MKRRDFIKVSGAAGIAAMGVPGYSEITNSRKSREDGFDLHPFIRKHPEAVFINLTSIKEKTDSVGIYNAASKLGSEMFVKTTNGKGYPNSTKINCKPNWTCNRQGRRTDPIANMGITTDLNFIEGFLNSVKAKGPEKFFLRESACFYSWKDNGYLQMAERNNFDLRELTSKDFWDLNPEDIIFKEVDGVVSKKVGFMAPMNEPDTFLINIAKLKAHQMGMTGAIKNLQGIGAKKFSNICGGYFNVFKTYDKRYHECFQPDYMERIVELHKKHVEAGIPRWRSNSDKPPTGGGAWMEQWVNRMLDFYSVTPTGINIVEGIYGREGDGFFGGPNGSKENDIMCNNTIFGKDAFRVDIIAHWLAGHEPGNFGLFHIGIERGLSDVLDPFDIPVYLWENGKAKLIKLDSLKRTPLRTLYLRRNYDGMNEDKYHLCNEEFDYSSWKNKGIISQSEVPSIHALGQDSSNNIVMEVGVPEEGDVYVDILNRDGELVWRMEAEGLEPGKHQVVWDGFSEPGLYNVYVKGMGWDAEKEMVIYT